MRKTNGMNFESPPGTKLRWTECVRAGRELDQRMRMSVRATYPEIQRAFRMRTHQQAYYETLVALGKVAILLKKQVRP